jgi:ELWxxDGT repeat protein
MTPLRGWRPWCALAGLALSLGLAAPGALFGAAARLLVDANPARPGPNESGVYRPPSQLTALGGRAIFFVESSDDEFYQATPGPGIMLWITDGTEEGTQMIAGFCTDEIAGCQGRARVLGQVGGAVLFELPKARFNYDRELWRTDGTREGTFLLKSVICPQPDSTDATEVIAGGVLFFAGFDAEAGCELWRSDGTAAGTRRIAILDPGGPGSEPRGFAALGERVFFSSSNSYGLRVTDGTSGGTSIVASPFPQLLTAAGGRLFFVVQEDDGGYSLWASDGTSAGTRPLRHFAIYAICDGPHDCTLQTPFLQADGDGVVFVANDGDGQQFWRSDGTAAGTQRLTSTPKPATPGYSGLLLAGGDAARLPGSLLLLVATDGNSTRLWSSRGGPASLLSGCSGGCPSVASFLHAVPGGRRVVFAGWNRDSKGIELWTSDGTAAGTFPASDLCAGRCSPVPDNFVAVGDAVYFTTATEKGVPALWRTNGTRAGTVSLGRAAFSPSLPPGGAALGDQVVLGMVDGRRVSELWITGGSAATTRPLATFDRATSSADPQFASLGNRVVFTTWNGLEGALWSSDGITTPRLVVARRGGRFSAPVVAGDHAFLFTGDFEDEGIFHARLVATDGTIAGTRTIADLGETFVHSPHEFGGRLVFEVGSIDQQRLALWASNGTFAGTRPLLSLPPGEPMNLMTTGGFLYFFSRVGDGVAFFRSDGTAAGTTSFASFGDGGVDFEVAEAGSRVYFTADGFLCRLDGSTIDHDTFAGYSEVVGLTEFGGRLLFFGIAGDGSSQRGLWSTDGTVAGTTLLARVSVQPQDLDLGSFRFSSWTRAGGHLLFRGWDAEHGFELWITDGTAAGTTRLDLAQGSPSAFPDNFAAAAGRVWFTANDGVHGRELWVSDGTAAGTHQTEELAPGTFSALPSSLTAAGGNLFFSATTPFKGREPWVLPLAGVP